MKKVLRWAVFIPFGAILVLFLIANRQPVALSLDPFSTEAPALATPAVFLWVWLVLALLVGFFAGAIGMWVSDRELRIRAKAERQEIKALKKQLADAQAALAAAKSPPPMIAEEAP